jgi:hypothetical protein
VTTEGRGSGISSILSTVKSVLVPGSEVDLLKKILIVVTQAGFSTEIDSPDYASLATVKNAIFV